MTDRVQRMTREDIEWLRDQAGPVIVPITWLERFAALVAAAEREACAKVCDELNEEWGAGPNRCAAAIRAMGAP